MIEKVELLRLEQGADGTFGVLRLNGCVHCVTLEPPDRNNERDLSSIPEGSMCVVAWNLLDLAIHMK